MTRPRPRVRLRLWQMGHKLETNPQAACDPLTGTSPALSLPVSLPSSNLCCCCCGLSGSSSNPKPHSKRITVRKRKKQERQRTLRGRQSVNKCRRDETTRAEREIERERERSDPIVSLCAAVARASHDGGVLRLSLLPATLLLLYSSAPLPHSLHCCLVPHKQSKSLGQAAQHEAQQQRR